MPPHWSVRHDHGTISIEGSRISSPSLSYSKIG